MWFLKDWCYLDRAQNVWCPVGWPILYCQLPPENRTR